MAERTLTEVVNDWMEGRKEVFLDNYDRFGLRASGNTVKKTAVETKRIGNVVTSNLEGPEYVIQMNSGRKPSQDQSPKAVNGLYPIILEWQQQKQSLPAELKTKGAAWGIAYKIVHDGIKVPNQYNPGGVLTKAFGRDAYNELYEKLRNFYVEATRTTYIEGINSNSDASN